MTVPPNHRMQWTWLRAAADAEQCSGNGIVPCRWFKMVRLSKKEESIGRKWKPQLYPVEFVAH